MNASKLHNKNFFFLSFLLLLFSVPSSAFNIIDTVFPKVTVTVENHRNKTVFYLCSFNGSESHGELLRLEPGERRTWPFREVFAPIHWCYFYLHEDLQGFVWAYTPRKLCRDCLWAIKDDGAYFLMKRRVWLKHYLWSTKYAEDNADEKKGCSETCASRIAGD